MTGKPDQGTPDRFGELLGEQMRQVTQAQSREDRKRAFDGLADLIARANAVVPVLNRFLAGDLNSQRFGLEVASRVPPPDEAFAERLVRLLENRRFPPSARLRSAVQILRAFPGNRILCGQVLGAAIAGLNRQQSYDRLRLLQSQVPNCPALDQLCEELGQGLLMECPKCRARLERAEMVTHLWREHRLLLEGGKVRDPWRLVEEWIQQYAKSPPEKRGDLLNRCYELGRHLDPDDGLVKVHRLLLASGNGDEEARTDLETKAVEQQATLCPHCFAVVPEANDFRPGVSVSRGRIAGRGYAVEIADQRISSRLVVATPKGVVYDGPEPGRRLTRRGSVLLKIGPLVLAALAVAALLPVQWLPPLAPVALLLLVAVIWYMRMRLVLDRTENPTERAVVHAWQRLAPRLYKPAYTDAAAGFLAGLSQVSIGVGDAKGRENVVERLRKLTQQAVTAGAAPAEALASVKRLELEDAAHLNQDRVMLLANEVTACFAGTLPIRYAEELLASWPMEALDVADRARLRVLLLAKAFEAGLEVPDLHELGRAYPFLGQAYASEDVPGMARLRWLGLIKPQRPWRKIGSATPVLDLARFPALAGQYLQLRPDLLLFQPVGDDGSEDGTGAPILICEEGVLYREILIDDPDIEIQVHPRSVFQGGGFEMHIGSFKLTFRTEPDALKKRLEGWLKYLFKDFLPQAERVLPRRSGLVDRLLRQKLSACPECAKPFLTMRGEVGIPYEETPAETPASA